MTCKDRCLLIGASGQLGEQLLPLLGQSWEIIPTACRTQGAAKHHLDLEHPDEAVERIRKIDPKWVVIAGAWCNVDGAQQYPVRCRQVNGGTPDAIAREAQAAGRWVVYFSTDYLFDGQAPIYTETMPIAPMNIYAQSKAVGEEAIRSALPGRHLILRTAWLYGPGKARRNFILRLVDTLRAGHTVEVPSDQWGTPTYTEDLAKATVLLMNKQVTGTYHAAGPSFVNRLELAKTVCRQFELDPSGLQPRTTAELKQAAERPLRVRMDCTKLLEQGVEPFRTLQAGLKSLWAWDQAEVPR